MENKFFIANLYEQEKALFDKVINSKEYRELCLIQGLLVVRGETPRFSLLEETKKIIYNTNLINGKLYVKETAYKSTSPEMRIYPGKYDIVWGWQRKTKFALEALKKATTREIIDFLSKQEKNIKGSTKTKISANVYSALSKLARAGQIIKDDTDPNKLLYELASVKS